MGWKQLAYWTEPRTFRKHRIQAKNMPGVARATVRHQTRLPSADSDSDAYKWTTKNQWTADHNISKAQEVSDQ